MTTGRTTYPPALRFFLFVTLLALLAGVFLLGERVGEQQPIRRQPFSLLAEAWDTLKAQSVHQPVDSKKAEYGAIRGMTESLDDPYTLFLTPDEAESFQEEIEGTFEGIGAEIGLRDEQLVVIAPIASSPAERAGLKAGDAILGIDAISTEGVSLSDAVDRIRGESGTVVTLTIRRRGEEAKDLSITRDRITIESVSLSYPTDRVALIRLSYFGPETAADMQKAVVAVRVQGAEDLILDLRNNPGGFLDAAIDVASLFLPKGTTIVIEQNAKGEETPTGSDRDPVLPDIPLAVLVDRGSASGSEIVAGALQDAKRATVIGEKTFGKGTVQELLSLSDGSDLKITVARWLTPAKRSIDKEGIQPDVSVEAVEGDPDEQLDKAIELLSVNEEN